jgi:hypothetical protein
VNPLVSDRLKRSADDAASAAPATSTVAMRVDSAGASSESVANSKGAKLSLSLDTSTTDFDVALINLPAETRPDLIKVLLPTTLSNGYD